MLNLVKLTEQVTQQYQGTKQIVLSAQQISLKETGLLNTWQNEFPLTREASEQFAQRLRIPSQFYLLLEPDIQAVLFNRFLQKRIADDQIEHQIRLILNKDDEITGYDNPRLLTTNPVRLMEIVTSSLTQGLSAESIEVSRLHISPTLLSFSCFTPEISTEPRKNDIINGGIDIHHSTSGEFGTRIRCYLRRLVCLNGATVHVCKDEKHARARRLNSGSFDENDMFEQIHRLLTQAWSQLNVKLEAVKSLLDQPRMSASSLRQQRTRYSLNNRLLRLIQKAIERDEFGPTGTQYDWFNAISRIATHELSLSCRQQQRLMDMAGECSQQHVRHCSKCGSWIITHN